MNEPWSKIDGFVIGVLPPESGTLRACYENQKYLGYRPPLAQPFQIGEHVSKSPVRPSDLAQEWTVVGMAYSPYTSWDGWKATIARKGTTELHRNSLYTTNAHNLFHLKK